MNKKSDQATTYRLLPSPMPGHQVRPHSLPRRVGLLKRRVVPLAFELGVCDHRLEESERITGMHNIRFAHPGWRSRRDGSIVAEVLINKM